MRETNIFKVLADSQRRAILMMLRNERLNAGEIAEKLQITPAALSYHLKLLKNADLKSTKKRCLLLSILQTEDRAMTAEELLEKATPILPMNASTVYRTLNTLTEKGVLSKSLRKDGKSYFSLEKHDHHHRLVCTVCRKVIPVDSCPLKELEEDLEAKTGFRITGHTLEFSGICPECRKSNGL